ncbi:MAG: protease-like activity factor CPAF [Elusimicrobia bacterium]|nr:protease-like activity factor CPAF [Elusimicrobiota bacterium]
MQLLTLLVPQAIALAPALLWAQTISPVGRVSAPVLPSGAPYGLTSPRLSPRITGIIPAAPFAGGSALPSLPSLSLAPSAIESASPETGLPAASLDVPAVPAQGQGRAGAAESVDRMTREVAATLEAAGPAEERSSEEDRGAADSVFRTLTDETSGPDGYRASDPANLTQRKMVATLYKVASIFSEHYAPVDWKKGRFRLDLKAEFDKAVTVILSEPNIGTRRFQSLLVDFTAATRDYHVTITFHSTEKARLPLLIMGAEGKYFIAYIDREKLPKETFPFVEGDEVLEFDGKPTAKVVLALARVRTGNTAESDMRLAEITLTHRSRRMGEEVPQGPVAMKVQDRHGKAFDVKMEWDYTPEKIPLDVPVRDAGLDTPDGAVGEAAPAMPESWDGTGAPSGAAPKLKDLMSRLYTRVAHPLSGVFAEMRAAAPKNPFLFGAEKGFLPPLGPVVWKAKGDNPFDAYIYTDRQGRKFAHVRISHYDGGEDEAHAFGLLMGRFQKDPEVQGLVIDQTNNPGGNLFYVYALASRLTDKPLVAPKHRLIVDESDAAWALDTIEKLSDPEKLEAELEDMAESDEWAGYPVTDAFIELIVKFARFILSELGAGRRLTGPTHMWGVDDIMPAPAKERFTKPVLLLVNENDYSGGDFFPAIMQDNGRAAIMGVGTAGAGGAVKSFELANQFGIADLAATWTLALRKNGKPIENLRVMPDIPYTLTEKDFKAGFAPYRRAINAAMDKLVRKGGP